MKVYDRDLKKIKIDVLVNNEIRFRGMRKPLAKIKVKAIKYDNGIVDVKLVDSSESVVLKYAYFLFLCRYCSCQHECLINLIVIKYHAVG